MPRTVLISRSYMFLPCFVLISGDAEVFGHLGSGDDVISSPPDTRESRSPSDDVQGTEEPAWNPSPQTLSTHLKGGPWTSSSLQNLLSRENTPEVPHSTVSTRSPKRFLNLTNAFLSSCLRRYDRLSLQADSGQVTFDLKAGSLQHMRHRQYCYVNITVPAKKIVHVHIVQMTVPCCSARFRLLDFLAVDANVFRSGCGRYSHYRSQGNALSLSFTLINDKQDVVIRFNFTSRLDDKPELEMVYVSSSQGYVQTPLFDGQTVRTPVKMDTWVRVDVPDLHSVLISFPHVDIEALWVFGCDMLEYLHVYSCTRNRKTLLWEVCNAKEPPPPSLLQTDAVLLHYVSDTGTSPTTGFRVLFSFHNQSRTPLQMADQSWNCSVAFWPAFKQHLECNLESECEDKEDEAQCGYSSSRCSPGLLAVADSCYVYVTANETVTWYDASIQCSLRGGHLASLNSPQEWREVLEVLNLRPNVMIYLGLKSAPSTAPHIYHDTFLWADGSVVYYSQVFNVSVKPFCSVRPIRAADIVQPRHLQYIMTTECDSKFTRNFLCEVDHLPEVHSSPKPVFIFSPESMLNLSGSFTVCPAGHVTHSFLSCDWQSSCWVSEILSGGCQAPLRPLPPAFTCRQSIEGVPYTLVCDFRPDCGDSSDEDFCVFPLCQPVLHFDCGNRQCVARSAQCDGLQQCANGMDELDCYQYRHTLVLRTAPPPAVVHFTGYGNFTVQLPQSSINAHFTGDGNFTVQPPRSSINAHFTGDGNFTVQPPRSSINAHFTGDGNFTEQPPRSSISALSTGVSMLPTTGESVSRADRTVLPDSASHNSSCPTSHFMCPTSHRLPGQYYCLPVYVRCNGVYDCPGREDEEGCATYSCPGLYRCRSSPVCLHRSQVCDGVSQCPQQDDELLCEVSCPAHCTCYGLAFFCNAPFPAGNFPQLRFLDASGSRVTLEQLVSNTMLIQLTLTRCHLKHISSLNFSNLCILDLSHNHIRYVNQNHFKCVGNLRDLSLAANPLQLTFAWDSGVLPLSFPSVVKLDLSGVRLRELDMDVLALFPSVTFLNLSNTELNSVSSKGFQMVSKLRVLDVQGCPLSSFSQTLFSGLHFLHTVYADNYKLCCPTMLPEGFNTLHCHAPFDEISSCEDLLRSPLYRIMLALFAILNLMGNLATFAYRTFVEGASGQQSYGIFVHHLCVSDFCMGVYLTLIGVADRLYQGSYVWKDLTWRHSLTCKAAGFLSLLSSEVSVCLICVITLDRLLVLHCPFTTLRFDRRTALVACIFLWTVGLVMAGVPLMPYTSHWQLYSQNAICVPLPILKSQTPGNSYSFSILVVFNFVIFMLIALGQSAIYWSVRHNSLAATHCTKPNKDLTIAQRLITVAMSDFLCWFPIGFLALLATAGYVIPGEVNVAMAMLVLPVNSAINPFLYTLNIILEKRQRAREQRLFAIITAQLKAKVTDSHAISKST